MKKGLFREEALKKASSPEELNEYIKVTNPGVWITLVAVIVIIIGGCIWGIFGRIEETVEAIVVSDGTQTFCYVDEYNWLPGKIENDSFFELDGVVYNITSVPKKSKKITEYPLLCEKSGLDEVFPEDEYYELKIDKVIPKDAICDVNVVVESIKPLSFVFN